MSYFVGHDSLESRSFLTTVFDPSSRWYFNQGNSPNLVSLGGSGFIVNRGSYPYYAVFIAPDWLGVTPYAVPSGVDCYAIEGYFCLKAAAPNYLSVVRLSDLTRVYTLTSSAVGNVYENRYGSGGFLCTFSASPKARYFPAPGFTPINLSSDPANSVSSVKYSPDGVWAAISYSGTPNIRIYNLTTGAYTLGSFSYGVYQTVFSPDSQFLAFTRTQAAYGAYLYKVSTGVQIGASIPISSYSNKIAFTADSRFFVYQTSNNAEINSTSDGASVLSFVSGLSPTFDIFPDGGKVLLYKNSAPYLSLYDANTRTSTTLDGFNASPGGAVFFPSVRRFAVYGSSAYPTKVYDMDTLALVASVDTPVGGFTSASIAPDNSVIVGAASRSTGTAGICLYDPLTFTVIGSMLPGSNSTPCFSNDSKALVVAYTDAANSSIKNAAIFRKLESGWAKTYNELNVPWTVRTDLGLIGQAPTVKGRVIDSDGNNAAVDVLLVEKANPRKRSIIATSNAQTGLFEAGVYSTGDHIAVVMDNRELSYRDVSARIQPRVNNADEPLVLRLAHAGALCSLEGNATKASGAPVDGVVIFEWSSSLTTAKVVPATNGDWSATVPVGQYGLLYLADGCAPVTHGPYTVSAS